MKLILKISLGVLFISIAGFIISVAATMGSYEDWYSDDMLTDTFEYDDMDNLDIGVVTADVNVRTGDVAKITVNLKHYSDARKITSDCYNDKIKISQKISFNIFPFGISYWLMSSGKDEVEVIIPANYEKEYSKVNVSTVSGNIDISDIAAENLDINTTSADVALSGTSSEFISINTVSGEIDFNGNSSGDFDFDSVSGDVKAFGLSGGGKVNTVSGDVRFQFTAWNGDVSANTISGDVDIDLPENAGYNVSFSSVSGDVKCTDANGNMTKGSNGFNNSFSGDNMHRINIDTVSGNAKITVN